jgi:hypothetical protein
VRPADDDEVPPVYRRALQLADAGADTDCLARELDVDPAAVANLLLLARAKVWAAPVQRGGEVDP